MAGFDDAGCVRDLSAGTVWPRVRDAGHAWAMLYQDLQLVKEHFLAVSACKVGHAQQSVKSHPTVKFERLLPIHLR